MGEPETDTLRLIPNTPINHPKGTTPKHLLDNLQDAGDQSSTPISPLSILRSTAPPLQPLDPNRKTLIMSILNMTPDSFSDGGKYDPRNESFMDKTISDMIADGADILDIGGESTRPGSMTVSPEEELSRILPTIKLAAEQTRRNETVSISVDTYRASVAAEALDAGAHIINDISGGTLDPDILSVAAKRNATIALGHIRGTPQTMTRPENTHYEHGKVAETIANELLSRVRTAEQAGVRRWRILLDPGFGFAKTYETNVELLKDFQS